MSAGGAAPAWQRAGVAVSRALAWLGGAMLLLSAALITLDVVFRSLFKLTYFDSFELSTYAFAVSTALGMSYALVTRAHIRIELLYTALPARQRAWLDVVAHAGLALCMGLLLYWCAKMVAGNWSSGARSNSSLALRLAYPQGLWLLGLGWFALLSTVYAVAGLWSCLRGRPEQAHRQLGMASLEEEIDANTASTGAKSC